MIIRPFDAEKDKEACYRIWREVGWLEKGKEEQMDSCFEAATALVAEIHGEAECLVLSTPANLRYLEEELSMDAVAGVTTSHISRKQGLAGRVLALSIANRAKEGMLVSALGMFDQGFYNLLGFGTGGYEHHMRIDPAHLVVPVKARIPRRLTLENVEAMHNVRLNRMRRHGSCNLLPVAVTKGEFNATENAFGLGYFDGEDGALSHYILGSAKGEHGPYRIHHLIYQNYTQFLELMALIKNLGDQVNLVTLHEPPDIQLQDFLKQPFKNRRVTQKSEFEVGSWSAAYWQMRINNLEGCLAKTHLDGKSVRFQLHLTDPIEKYLNAEEEWRGISGDYVVTLGEESQAVKGIDSNLPVLTTTVNAFTRLWLGVRPATGLAVTDSLVASPELLAQLNRILCLPQPRTDWDF